MSAFEEIIDDLEVSIGYDGVNDFVYMSIYDMDDKLVYDHTKEVPNIYEMKDIDFFVNIAKDKFSIEIPKKVILDIKTESHFKKHLERIPIDDVILYQYELIKSK